MACAGDLVGRLNDVLTRISSLARTLDVDTPRLVAVSKTKPVELIRQAYDGGQRHFGENYVQELLEKATDPLLQKPDVRWHFIGRLQSNKINKLVTIPNLWMVETIDSTKLASTLHNSWSKTDNTNRLKILIQVNTSGEDTKAGCPVDSVLDLAVHIWNSCPKLQLCGLMTIGRIGHDYSLGPNQDFTLLKQLRTSVSSHIDVRVRELELSMGMSDDYEEAVKAGSTNVRVGSVIFGSRCYT